MEHECFEELQRAREEIDYLKSVLAKVTNELAIVLSEKRKLEKASVHVPKITDSVTVNINQKEVEASMIVDAVMKKLHQQLIKRPYPKVCMDSRK